MNVVHDNVKMIHVSVRAQYHPLEDPHTQGLETLASGIRMGEEAASWWQLKKFFVFFFSFFACCPPIRIAYLHTQECEGSVQYNYIIIPKF